jgi:hypothetical protein
VATGKDAAARFVAEMLGLPAPSSVGPFAVVQVGDTSLDFVDSSEEIASQHYAFLVEEDEFDQIFARIRERGLTYWPIPSGASEAASTTGTAGGECISTT